MKRYLHFSLVATAAMLVLTGGGRLPLFAQTAPASGAAARETEFQDRIRPFVRKNCLGCHNAKNATAGIALDADVKGADVVAHSGAWEKALRKIRTGEMPPPPIPKPAKADATWIVNWIERELDAASVRNPEPGRVAIHRLNRAEYNNAVRDLLAVDFTPADDFPADDAGYGFDNIADVLSLPPVLMEKYLAAAGKVTRQAVGLVKFSPALDRYTIERKDPQRNRWSDDLPFGTRGGAVIHHRFPIDSEYLIRARVRGDAENRLPPVLEFRIDGKRVKTFEARISNAEEDEGQRRFEFQLPVAAGRREIAVTFLRESSLNEEAEVTLNNQGNPVQKLMAVDYIEVGGPFKTEGTPNSPSRRMIFSCAPKAPAEEEPCASAILSRLARRAYRRPVHAADLAPLMRLYRMGRQDSNSFEGGVQVALKAVLVSPSFLFRLESEPASAKPGSIVPLSDLELASRLSFFLWSSIPDETLLAAAEKGQLKDAKILETQVRRMLADPKSQRFVENFAGQWLHLRNLAHVKPDPDKFPEFDPELREALARETELFFESIVRSDASVIDFLDAPYTFVNERLAKHYGIPGIQGRHFRKVAVDPATRGGVLSQGSVLTVSSYPTRTSPVIRGKWVLENLLGAPPPPPPPNVPELRESEIGQSASLRQQMEQHRSNPVCAACHSKMDHIGFALENYDAIGRWRTKDGKFDIDASGVLPNGTAFQNPQQFKAILREQKQEFVQALAEKMLTYALGRGLERYDRPVVRTISREMAGQDYRFSSLVRGIVNSTPFRLRRAAEPKEVLAKLATASSSKRPSGPQGVSQ